ncbi:PLDc N-terminal domain-containing protein [Microbacterium hydrothermale]|uniref:PLDc N-terminal domain-containing protein n=1 Tax=Microbacterium hydrothermale TaxID=857427 RepID=UPI002227E6F6|nr:PLDc N-terminal domain-containing protein [Microbacterium hydrothermale]
MAEGSNGFFSYTTSPIHVLILVASTLLIAVTFLIIVMLWRDNARTSLEKVMWTLIVLLFPVIGTTVVGAALVWNRVQRERSRKTVM